jgi:GTP-binding protein Era
MSHTSCGYIALIGAPNAGKSTLLNALVGQKISIVTPKAQTTRNRITGVVLEGDAQLIFIDVPGVFETKKRFEGAMVETAYHAAGEADVLVFMHDAVRAPSDETIVVIERLKHIGKPMILALNKIDMVKDKKILLDRVAAFQALAEWDWVFMISARKQDGLADLRQHIASKMPKGPWLFPEDHITDVPMRMLAAELTREQCFMLLREELPYTLHVETETYEEQKDGSVKLNQVIIVQNERQKMIVIGKGGAQLKKIGTQAREQISRAFGVDAHVMLFVKVREDWKENPETYRVLGLKG